MRVPFPPARITPRMAMPVSSKPAHSNGSALFQLPVLLLVVVQVVLGLDPGDPRGVRLVPGNSIADAAFEGPPRHPAQFAFRLRAVDGVTAIVAGAVFDVADQRPLLAKQVEQGMREVEV